MHKAILLRQSAQVHYRVSVIEGGRVVRQEPRKKNLILDQGLDGIASRSWAASFARAAVGTGTRPTRRDSGAVTFERTGTTVTASANFFELADEGRILKMDSGEEMYITEFTDATHVEVGASGVIAATEGTVWYVDDTALESETKRSSTYVADSGANGATFVGDTWTLKRTFIFSAESGTVNYREIGWSHTASPGANLFGRDVLAGSGVTLVAGQQLKVEVELSVTLSPSGSTPWAQVVTGWTQDGAHAVECPSITVVDAAGASAAWQGAVLEPSTGKEMCLSTDSPALLAMTQNPTLRSTVARKAMSAAAYSPGAFAKTWTVTFLVGEGNAALRSLFLGLTYATSQRYSIYRVLLDAAETKDSDHTLTLEFTLSWGRVLTN